MNRQKLVLVSVFSGLAFCYPFLSIANRQQTILGVPALFLYLGCSWIVIIVILYRLSERTAHSGEVDDE